VTKVDLGALLFCALTAIIGWRKGAVATALSVAGIVLGAWLGSRLGPQLLDDGSDSPYTPLAALAGAAVGAIVLETVGTLAGTSLRAYVRTPRLRSLDAAGGVVLGAFAGLAVVWVIGAVALLLPGQSGLRSGAQGSFVLRRLNEVVPPRQLLNALARIDPFPSFAGPPVPTEPPDPRVLQQPGVRAAAPSVVRVLGTACGLGVEGSGWVAEPELVVTAAHVVAGEDDTEVVEFDGHGLAAQIVGFDPHDDIAVLRVPGLDARPLRLVDPRPGASIAIAGYPLNGPFTAGAGRIGATENVLAQDAYGHGPTRRLVTSLSGRVQHGNSGGPAVDGSGAVQSTVFAARAVGGGGYGVPASVVRRDLGRVGGPVSPGSCVG